MGTRHSWIFVGTAGFSSGIAEYPSIAIDTGGTPFVVYGDYDASGNATVMKFDGTSWVLVGSAGFSSYSGGKSPIVIDRSGKPYIAYAEGPSYGYKATVMKFDGTSWGVLGSHGFSAGVANNMSLALDTADVPYIGYMDASFPGGVVAKFDGSSWVNVGTPGISGVGLQTISLAIDARNTPYFAYQSSTTPSSPGVMQFNGSTWNSFPGLSGTSGGGNVSIAVDGSTPYLAFIDDNNSDKASVMRLEIARITGTDTVCTTAAVSLSDTSAGGSWSSSNTAVAIVSTAGVVTGVSGGTAIISYSIGGFVAADTVIVNSLPDVSSITGASTVCVDSVVTLTDITTGGTWGSSDATVATAGSTTGVVNGIMAGTAVISYSVTNSCGTTVKTRNITVDACLPTSAMTQAGLNSSINLFPSPAHGSFNIRVSSPQKENTVVTITNVLGKVITKFTAATNEDVSVQFDAPAGMYFLSAVTKDNTESTKFITN